MSARRPRTSAAPEQVRFQFASDLHLEWLQRDFPGERLIDPLPDADALILAGDVANLEELTGLFADWPVPVFLVPGNHEFYGLDLAYARQAIRRGEYNVGALRVLDDEEVLFKGVRLLGSTLWTDYRLHAHLTLPEALAAAQAALSGADHGRIRFNEKRFRPEDALALHAASRQWLKERLASTFDGPTLVVSHHAPSIRSMAPKWRSEDSSVAFASELVFLPLADYWIHGHLHDRASYLAGNCQVLANPRGYGRGAAFADSARDMFFETEDFDAAAVLSVPVGPAWRAYQSQRPVYTAPRWQLRALPETDPREGQWEVHDEARSYACASEADARWLLRTLNAVERQGLQGEPD